MTNLSSENNLENQSRCKEANTTRVCATRDVCYECEMDVVRTSSVTLHPCNHMLCLHCMIEQQALTRSEPSLLCPCGENVLSHQHVRLTSSSSSPSPPQSSSNKRRRPNCSKETIQETVVTFDYGSAQEDDEEDENEAIENERDDNQVKQQQQQRRRRRLGSSRSGISSDHSTRKSAQAEAGLGEAKLPENLDKVTESNQNSSNHSTTSREEESPFKKRQPDVSVLKVTYELLEEYNVWSTQPEDARGPHPVYEYLESLHFNEEKGWLRIEEAR